MFRIAPPKIEFLCRPEDRGVIAEPQPAKAFLPAWFKKLPAIDAAHASAVDNGITIKRCMPFLDALTLGWIIPLAATVRLEISEGGRSVKAGWEFDRELVSFHGAHQVTGHPREPLPSCKFHNFWTIRTPPGWSCLIAPPLNRPNPVFEILSGVVDTDRYVSPIHFPFHATAPDGLHVLEKNTPIAQIIPFRRNATIIAANIRVETGADAAERERVRRATLAGDGWYRREARATR